VELAQLEAEAEAAAPRALPPGSGAPVRSKVGR
jgi:hypothetical protein